MAKARSLSHFLHHWFLQWRLHWPMPVLNEAHVQLACYRCCISCPSLSLQRENEGLGDALSWTGAHALVKGQMVSISRHTAARGHEPITQCELCCGPRLWLQAPVSGKHSLLPTPRKHIDLMSSAVSGVVSTCELNLQMGKYLNSAMPSVGRPGYTALVFSVCRWRLPQPFAQ